MNNSFALIELSSSHDECIYSQVMFLKSASLPVHLIVPEEMGDRLKGFPVDGLLLLKLSEIKPFKILQYLVKNKIKNIVINTCSGNDVRNLIFFIPWKMNITGILHNGEKLNSTNSQSLISMRVKKYFVLNDYILKNVKPSRNITVQSMYPIYFKTREETISKPESETWICIPGSLDRKRRDYDGLIEALEPASLKGIKFLILGKTKAESEDYNILKSDLERKKILHHFTFFFDFINLHTFHAYLKKSDLIMPLIHPSKKKYESYKKYKISGSFNLAFAYKKILLMEQTWQSVEDFKKTSVFYSLDDVRDVLQQVRTPNHTLSVKESYNSIKKFDFGFQSAQYVSLVTKES